MCCLEETDDSTAEPPEEAPNSQRSEDSHSQSLATHGGTLTKEDERSRAMSSSAMMHGDDSDNANSSDNEFDHDDSEMASAASLFGSVVRTVGPRPTDMARRATRRRRQHSPEGRRALRASDDGHGSDGSRDLLADSSSDDEEEEMQALDVSTRRNTYNDTDRGNTSSPELVYGRQHK